MDKLLILIFFDLWLFFESLQRIFYLLKWFRYRLRCLSNWNLLLDLLLLFFFLNFRLNFGLEDWLNRLLLLYFNDLINFLFLLGFFYLFNSFFIFFQFSFDFIEPLFSHVPIFKITCYKFACLNIGIFFSFFSGNTCILLTLHLLHQSMIYWSC